MGFSSSPAKKKRFVLPFVVVVLMHKIPFGTSGSGVALLEFWYPCISVVINANLISSTL